MYRITMNGFEDITDNKGYYYISDLPSDLQNYIRDYYQHYYNGMGIEADASEILNEKIKDVRYLGLDDEESELDNVVARYMRSRNV